MRSMIIYEDEDIMVIHKPAGIATETARLGQADVVSELKNIRSRKKEDTYIGVVHRLDQPVEGLLVFGKNAKATSALNAELQKGTLKKSYHALVLYNGDKNQQEEGTLVDYLVKDGRTNLSKVVNKGTKDAKRAELTYTIEKTYEDGYALAKVEILTGRHHQIRVQMSHAGMPLLGDNKYGNAESRNISEKKSLKNTALLADVLELKHPRNGENKVFTIPFPEEWKIN